MGEHVGALGGFGKAAKYVTMTHSALVVDVMLKDTLTILGTGNMLPPRLACSKVPSSRPCSPRALPSCTT